MTLTVSPSLNISTAPALPGLTFRLYRGLEDIPAITEVINASQQADQVEEQVAEEEMRVLYTHADDFNPLADTMLAEMDGVVVGFTRIFWRTTEAGERVYWMFGYLKPEWRRKGIGRAQLTWLEERVRGIDREQPFFGPRFFQAVAEDTALGKTALLESNGYTRARYFFFMKHSNLNALPDSPRPADLELRPAHPDQMRAIWDAKEEAFRDHWGFAPKGEGLYQTWRNNPHHDLDLWRVAWDGDQIAGSCINGINPEDNEQFGFKRGWIHTLSVRRAWRGRGVARALLVESLRVLAARGMTEAVLGVDSENPTGALRLYESVGFKTINQDALYRKTLD